MGKIFRSYEPSTNTRHCYKENHLQNIHANTLLTKTLQGPKKEYSNCPWFSTTADSSQIIRGREEQTKVNEIIEILKLYYTNSFLASPKLNLETSNAWYDSWEPEICLIFRSSSRRQPPNWCTTWRNTHSRTHPLPSTSPPRWAFGVPDHVLCGRSLYSSAWSHICLGITTFTADFLPIISPFSSNSLLWSSRLIIHQWFIQPTNIYWVFT